MIETHLSPRMTATVTHCVTGAIDRQQAEQGAAEALQLAQHLLTQHDPINLLLDLRGVDFLGLQVHKTWSLGFACHLSLQEHVRYVVIIGDDTPQFQAERALMETERVKFFVDVAVGQQWLAHAPRKVNPAPT